MSDRVLAVQVKPWIRPLLALWFGLALFSAFFVPDSAGSTPVTGVINAETTWTATGSPYVVSGALTVAEGSTLTIRPGVEVDFERYAGMDINGTIIAVGTAASPILFTGTTKTPGFWAAIYIHGRDGALNTGCLFDRVTIEYGESNLALEWAYPVVRHSVLRKGSNDGVYGRVVSGGTFTDVQAIDNAGWAFFFHDGFANSVLKHLTATGNGHDAVQFWVPNFSEDTLLTAPGIPYVLHSDLWVRPGATLTIEPGAELRFDGGGLFTEGRLLAIGTAEKPIKFTGTTAQKGFWAGITFGDPSGGVSAGSKLDYAIVEYGGQGGYGAANVTVNWAQVAISNSIIRLSADNGIYVPADGGDFLSIQSSQIVDNDGYGIESYMPGATIVSASNNWWGDASGPRIEKCGRGGTGSWITTGVAFLPFLTSPGGAPYGVLTPTEVFTLTLEPDRWFVSADNVLRSDITATLRDGTGQPISGRTVDASASLGTVESGGITDVRGRTHILVKSDTAGDSVVTAKINKDDDPCLMIRQASTTVTFTPLDAPAAGALTPDSESYYTTADITVDPEPLERGKASTFTVKLKNPYDYPILVNAVLGIAQSGIGLTFGPIHTWENVRIEAKATQLLQTPYTPLVEGHWCYHLDYSWRSAQSAASSTMKRELTAYAMFGDTSTGSAGGNTSSKGGGIGDNEELKRKFGISTRKVNLQPYNEQQNKASGDSAPKKSACQKINDSIAVTRDIGNSMRGDPPSQDYTTIVRPVKPVMPVYKAGDGNMTAQEAAAANELLDALAEGIAYGRAVLASDDRYEGAVEANDVTWAAQQTAAILYYRQQTGMSYLRMTDAMQQWLGVYNGNYLDYLPTVAEIQALQQRLRTSGFTADEKANFGALGATEENVDWIRRTFIAADPAENAKSMRADFEELIVDYRDIGNMLAYPDAAFSQQFTSAAPRYGVYARSREMMQLAAGAGSAQLARISRVEESIEVGNPLSASAKILLKTRRLGLPADWVVEVSPSTLTLGPGEHQSVIVRINPAATAVQGTAPSVAVEGYANGKLLGGVQFKVVVPTYTEFRGIGAGSSTPLFISEGGSVSTSTIGSSSGVKAGYSTLDMNAGTTPYGTAVFSFKQNGVTVTEAGVPASPPTKSARIFIDYRSGTAAVPGRADAGSIDVNTGIAIVNNGSSTANATYTLRDKTGATLSTGHGTIAGGDHVACFIDQLKEKLAPDFNLPSNFQTSTQFGSLEIKSDQPISVLALRGIVNQREEFLLTTTPTADLTPALSYDPIYFPQFVDGGGYTTSLVLLNTSTRTESGTLQILDDMGAPFTVNQVGGTADSSFRYSIPRDGVFRFQTDGFPANAKAGWVKLVPDAMNPTPVGSGVFSYNPADVLVTDSGIPAAKATTHARVYVDLSGNHNTGLAVANVGNNAGSITVRAYERDGVTAAGSSRGPLSLESSGHAAAFADQLVQGLPSGFTGVLDISSAYPFAALTLRSLDNERHDFLMTTFPVADANGTAPSPIVFPQIADGEGYTTQFILLSLGGASNATLRFWDESGQPLAVGK